MFKQISMNAVDQIFAKLVTLVKTHSVAILAREHAESDIISMLMPINAKANN